MAENRPPCSNSCPDLPVDVVTALLPFLSELAFQFQLALACKRFYGGLIKSSIKFYKEKWIKTKPASQYLDVLPQLPGLLSVAIYNFPDESTWMPRLNSILNLAPRLENLHLEHYFNEDDDDDQDVPAWPNWEPLLLSPETRVPSFPRLEKLYITLIASKLPNNLSFHLFPQLRELQINIKKLDSESQIDQVLEAISHNCPNLHTLTLFTSSVIPLKSLAKLRAARNLRNLSCESSRSSTYWPEYLELFHMDDDHKTLSEYVAAIDKFITMVREHCPVGLRLELDGTSLSSHLIDFCVHSVEKLKVTLSRIEKSELLFDSTPTIVNSGFSTLINSNLDMARVLLEYGWDLGAFNGHMLRSIFRIVPSVQLFQLVFETPLPIGVDSKMMTAFEFAQSLHPTFPFFCNAPLFTVIVSSKPNDSKIAHRLKLLDYIVANKERLIESIFGAESLLGGPFRTSLSGKSVVHYVSNLDVLKHLVEKHGVDPWVLDANGLTLLCHNSWQQKLPFLTYVLSLPSFDPQFVNSQGYSHIDLAILHTAGPHKSTLLAALVTRGGAIITPHTEEMLHNIKHPFDLKEIVPILELFKNEQLIPLMEVWHRSGLLGAAAEIIVTALIVKRLEPKDSLILERELLLKQQGLSMFTLCVHAKARSTLFALVGLVMKNCDKNKALCNEILMLWRAEKIRFDLQKQEWILSNIPEHLNF